MTEKSPVENLLSTHAWESMRREHQDSPCIRTPLIRSPQLESITGIREVYLKTEYLQKGNSFKFRGALHKLRSLQSKNPLPAVFAASAGNHGIGLSLAAESLGFTANIFVPTSTPDVKRKKIEAAGGVLHVVGKDFDESEAHAKRSCAEANGSYVSSFDDDYIIAGNGGSLAQELEADLNGDLDNLDVIVPIGGGGLASGIGAYFYDRNVRVFGIEPEPNCAMDASLREGRFLEGYEGGNTVADGLAGAISEKTFAICNQALTQSALVKEQDICESIGWFYENLGIVVEGSSALLGSVILNNQIELSDRVCLIMTGSNIDQGSIDKARNIRIRGSEA